MLSKFRLPESFLNEQINKKNTFGFNGLGFLTFLSTYSRIKEDGTLESWYDTVTRVVNGCYNIQKEHIIRNNNSIWNDVKGEKSAKEMYNRIFDMKFLPPGRGLWSMGTSITDERRLFTSLNNCAFVSTNNIITDLSKPFTFLMDVSMLGVGTGFDTKGEGKIEIYYPRVDYNNDISKYHHIFTRCNRLINMTNTSHTNKSFIINLLMSYMNEHIQNIADYIDNNDVLNDYVLSNDIDLYLQYKYYINDLQKLSNDDWNHMLFLTIEDSRDGWVDSLDMLLRSYFIENHPIVVFDFSLIRLKGEKLKAFGGVASGPGPLIEMIIKITSVLRHNNSKYNRIHELCDFINNINNIKNNVSIRINNNDKYNNAINKIDNVINELKKSYINEINKLIDVNYNHSNLITSRTIVDIMNIVGKAVVSGNIRRTAEIAVGEPTNEFIMLKDYGVNPERGSYSWTSNNSIFGTVGMDYTQIAERNKYNGEPGIFYLDNARNYGRLIDGVNKSDYRAAGTNPCGEQTLESYEMCCLVEVFINKHLNVDENNNIINIENDLNDFKTTLKYAYLYAKTVTLCQSHWPETNTVQLRNRRIGTSLTGVQQFKARLTGANNVIDVLSNGVIPTGVDKQKYIKKIVKQECIKWFDLGYKEIKYYDNIYSDYLAVPKSIKCTTIKPSGCVTPDTKLRVLKKSDYDDLIKKQGRIMNDQKYNIMTMRDLIFDMTNMDCNNPYVQELYNTWLHDYIREQYYIINEHGEHELINDIYLNGINEAYEITFDDGTSVVCTPNHKFKMQNNKWIEAQQININDMIKSI